MGILEYCQLNHLQEANNDFDLHFRLCRFCRKAMCETCFNVHKNHCCGQTQSSKKNTNETSPTLKKTMIKHFETSAKTRVSNSSKLHVTPSTTIDSPSTKRNTHVFPLCQAHSMLEDQFCVSHCILVCESCCTKHHETCNIKSASDVCNDLDHTTVTEYKKWLNNLRVSTIELKTRLGRSLDGAEQHKIKALNELQETVTKANKNINHAHLNLKSEIENTFDTQFSDLRVKIAKIEEINDKLDSSLKDAGPLEGSRMDSKQLLKLLDLTSKYNIRSVPLELCTLGGEFRKVHCSFIANNRYQPLSSRSNLGRINTSITKLSPRYTMPTSDLSHIFIKPSSNHAPSRTLPESGFSNKTTQNQIALISDEITESAKVASNADKERTKSESTMKYVLAKPTGLYAPGYVNKVNDQSNTDDDFDNDKHIVTNMNQTVNRHNQEMMAFCGQLTADNRDIGSRVGESILNQKIASAACSVSATHNKNNVVLLNGSPYVLVQYKSISDKCHIDSLASSAFTHENKESATKVIDHKRQSPGLTKQLKLSYRSHNTDDNEAHLSEQSGDETNSSIQTDITKCSNLQTPSINKIETTCSDKLEPCVSTPQTIEQGNTLKSTFDSDKCRKSIHDAVTVDSNTGIKQSVYKPVALFHHEKSDYFGKSAHLKPTFSHEQLQSLPFYNDDLRTKKPNTPNICTVATQPSTEIHKQKENNNIDALLAAAISVARMSQGQGINLVDDPPQNSNAYNNIALTSYSMKRDAGDTRSHAEPTINRIPSSLDAVDIYAANDLSQKTYIYSNVSDITKQCGSTLHEGIYSADIDSDAHGHQLSMLNNTAADYLIDNPVIQSDSYIPPFDVDLRSDNDNGAKLCDNNCANTISLPDSATSQTHIENNATITEYTMEMQRNRRVAFTGLTVKSVRLTCISITSDRCKPIISGCVFLPDCRVILCDCANDNLKLLDKSFTVQGSLDLLCRPRDISVVNNTAAIITLPWAKQLQYIEVTHSLQLGRVIQLDKECWGVQVIDTDIYVTCHSYRLDGEVRILDKNGNLRSILSLNKIKQSMISSHEYLVVSRRSNNIYVTDWESDTVTCLKPDGTVLFQYKDPDLIYSRGMCVDDEDNVIVCGEDSDNIHLVTAAGEKSYVILNCIDGIRNPRSIAYRRTDRTMILGSVNNEYIFVITFDEK